jgi:hypothetical protein
MLQTLLSSLRATTSNDPAATRRRNPRRTFDRCIIVIHGQSFPLENWSPGGVLISGDDRLFSVGQELDFTLKFKLRNTILDINHRGHIVRKGPYKVAMQFAPVTRIIKNYFQQVIDDHIAREFANSQASLSKA